jgi:hypothetical protein
MGIVAPGALLARTFSGKPPRKKEAEQKKGTFLTRYGRGHF